MRVREQDSGGIHDGARSLSSERAARARATTSASRGRRGTRQKAGAQLGIWPAIVLPRSSTAAEEGNPFRAA